MPRYSYGTIPAIFSESEFDGLVGAIGETYQDRTGVNLQEAHNLPGQREVFDIVAKLLEVIFPGFSEAPRHHDSLNAETAVLLSELRHSLFDQVLRALQYGGVEKGSEERSSAVVRKLLSELPAIREIMKQDVTAAYNGDPAATSYDEVILSYPCIKAITVQRLAHVLYCEHVPLIPRMMTEFAHAATGIDIHPGATLGKGVFIDHGTGVVIGETARIGDQVRIYQGVTLGALSFPKDAHGNLIKGRRRHPSVGDHVTIYANATVLGDVEIGAGSVIGGNVWLTESLPPGSRISIYPPEQQVRSPEKQGS